MKQTNAFIFVVISLLTLISSSYNTLKHSLNNRTENTDKIYNCFLKGLGSAFKMNVIKHIDNFMYDKNKLNNCSTSSISTFYQKYKKMEIELKHTKEEQEYDLFVLNEYTTNHFDVLFNTTSIKLLKRLSHTYSKHYNGLNDELEAKIKMAIIYFYKAAYIVGYKKPKKVFSLINEKDIKDQFFVVYNLAKEYLEQKVELGKSGLQKLKDFFKKQYRFVKELLSSCGLDLYSAIDRQVKLKAREWFPEQYILYKLISYMYEGIKNLKFAALAKNKDDKLCYFGTFIANLIDFCSYEFIKLFE